MKFSLRLLLVAFALSFLLVGSLAFVSIIRFSQLNNHVALVEHSYKVSNLIYKLEKGVREMDKVEFRYLLSRDSTYVERFDEYYEAIQGNLQELKRLTISYPDQHKYAILFGTDVELYEADAYRIRGTVRQPDVWASAEYVKNKQLLDSLANKLNKMAAQGDAQLTSLTTQRQFYLTVTSKMVWALTIVFSLFTLGLFSLLLKELKTRIAYQNELQQKVGEIARSKLELEDIAYATSHDLQEPLRKIRVLSDRWLQQNNDKSDLNGRATVDRVVAAAARMQALVAELVILTSLGDSEELRRCMLKDFVQMAAEDLDATIKEKNAVVEVEELPMISGYPDQLKLLFRNLLDNALKFTKPGELLLIQVNSAVAEGNELAEDAPVNQRYYCITIKDNGIGFDNKMAEKMFGIFRQLHSAKEGYTGKGAGLAICRRIMGNHKGQIVAHGFPGMGATFKLYFPISE